MDPVNKVLKGEIPWSQELRPEAKNFKTFFVHTVSLSLWLLLHSRRPLFLCPAPLGAVAEGAAGSGQSPPSFPCPGGPVFTARSLFFSLGMTQGSAGHQCRLISAEGESPGAPGRHLQWRQEVGDLLMTSRPQVEVLFLMGLPREH